MSDIKNKNYILATIDQLRARKSRPDINRICKFMLKSYKVAPRETKADLRRCVSAKVVYKVDYKDNVSYRNAAKWKRERKRTADEEKQSSNSSGGSERRLITSAIAELIYHEESCLERGVTFEELARAAASQATRLTKKQLEGIIQKELAAGSLIRLANGNLALGPADHDADSNDSLKTYDENMDSHTKVHTEQIKNELVKMTSSANSSCASSPLRMRGRPGRKRGGGASAGSSSGNTGRGAGVRVGERRKRAKKVFDPSDNNVPSKRKRGRPVGSLNKNTLKRRLLASESSRIQQSSTPRSESQASGDGSEPDLPAEDETSGGSEGAGGVCSVCLVQKPRGSAGRLVECRDCNNKAHIACVRQGPGMLRLRPDNTWQCPHCKTCVVCCETNDAGILTVCSVCSDAYHALCHSPRIPERLKAWDQWECSNCQETNPAAATTPPPAKSPVPAPSPPPPFLAPHELDRPRQKVRDETAIPVDATIPDISDWTSNDVYKYFTVHFPEAAHVFKEQDMDGRSLGLARRADIVRGLGLALGPALRLYRLVLRLQTRKDDFSMCWG